MDVEAAPAEESVNLLHQAVPAGVDTETHLLTSCRQNLQQSNQTRWKINIDMSINMNIVSIHRINIKWAVTCQTG